MRIELDEREVVAEPIKDAASVSGVVTKFSAIKEGRRYVVKRHGEAGAYILKLPSTRHPDLVENELTGYRLAASLGLQCAEATLISREQAELPEFVDCTHVLAVTRFDRAENGRRVHVEELAQALGYSPRQKYGRGLDHDLVAMLRLLDQLSVDPVRDVKEVVRRFVAFILMGNTDAHLKNWALLCPDGVEPKLAPLYDPVCVSAWFHDLPPADYAVNRHVDEMLGALTWDALEAIMHAAKLKRVSRVLSAARDTVKLARAEWPAILKDAPDNVRRSVTARLGGGVAIAK